MDPIISSHDTAFIDGHDRTRASLCLVDGSATGYLARQQGAQQAPQESARLDRYRRWRIITGACLALAVAGVGAWLLLTETPTASVMLPLCGLLVVAALPSIALSVRIATGDAHKAREIAQQVATLNHDTHAVRFLVRDSQDAAVEFNERHRGLFEYVLETMTPQRCARIRELAETGEREVVRQALVLLAQEYEPKHRQKQEAALASRDQAAQDLLRSSSGTAQRPGSHRA